MNPAPTLLSWIVTNLVMRNVSAEVEPTEADEYLEEGQILGFAGDAEVLQLPGHAAGQVGLLLPRHGGMLIAADAATNMGGRLGYPIVVEELETTKDTRRRLATLDFTIACFGHGRTVAEGAAEAFRGRFGSI